MSFNSRYTAIIVTVPLVLMVVPVSALGTSIIAHVALVSMVIPVRRKKMPVSHHLVYMEHV